MNRLIPVTTACALFLSITAGLCDDIRGLFVEQEHNPKAKKNTGVCYWLEVERKGESTPKHCSNKTVFHSGDRIRIHMKSNIDGYAYIVMLAGSDGEKKVLFPSESLGDNKVKAGTFITLPVPSKDDKSAWFKFDDHPGTELVRMIVSRTKVDPEQEHDGAAVVIASEDSADKVPDGTMVSITVSKASALKSDLRNLVIDHDAKPQTEGETTVVGGADKALAVDIALDHKEATK